MTAITLRDYQEEILQGVHREWDKVDRTLVQAATGTGKTIVYLALLDRLIKRNPDARALVLAHRIELIHQPIEKAERYFPALAPKMGMVMAKHDDTAAQVVVATVQTLNSGDRLERCGHFDFAIVDEAHHGTAASYQRVLDAMPDAKILGMTATPIRTDGDGLRKVFSSVAYVFAIDRAIERGALVPFDALGFGLPVRFDGIRETEDGWEQEAMGDILRAENCLEIVLSKWQEHAADRRTVLYTASVAQAHDTAAYFLKHGVQAEAVDGTTPKDLREAILARFRSGETQVVANCQVWTEGVDVPEINCVCMVCPTKSDLAYVQKLGRGLRTVPGKEDCLVLDFAPLAERNIIMAGDVLGVPRDVAKATRAAEEAGILLSGLHVDRFGWATSIDPAEITVKLLEYMRRQSSLAWVMDGNLAVATLSKDRTIAVLLPDPERIAKGEEQRRSGDWDERDQALLEEVCSVRVLLLERGDGYHWQSSLMGRYQTFQAAQPAADELARTYLDPVLAKRQTQWRYAPVSEKQIAFAHQLGIAVARDASRGSVAQQITFAIARKHALRWQRAYEAQILFEGERYD